jgi:hypothetical protein
MTGSRGRRALGVIPTPLAGGGFGSLVPPSGVFEIKALTWFVNDHPVKKLDRSNTLQSQEFDERAGRGHDDFAIIRGPSATEGEPPA